MLTLLRAGLYTSVQDAGRFGLRQSGVSYCGALDRPSLEIANLLVGNAGSTAALEITLGQCVIEFGQETWFALTGAGCDATLDGKAVWTGWRLRAKAGQRLTLKRPLHGVRSYLAVAGGIDVPEVLGSASTDQKAGIGGHEGRSLRDGDRLAIKPSTRDFSTTQGVKQLLWGNVIRALPGPEYQEFDDASKESFWRSPWKISPQSNRMGYRLQGQPLASPERSLPKRGKTDIRGCNIIARIQRLQCVKDVVDFDDRSVWELPQRRQVGNGVGVGCPGREQSPLFLGAQARIVQNIRRVTKHL